MGVPLAENTAQGKLMAKFYATNKLQRGDKFIVRVVP